MSTSMEMDRQEEVHSASGSVPTPMEVEDSEKMNDPVEPQAKSVFDMIVVIRDLLPRVTYNKNQCERIAHRFNKISDEAMKIMEVQENSELFEILKRGQMLVQGYAEPTDITAREISRGDNRDEFKEFHEDLHLAWAKLGFPSLPKVEKSDLQDDAEKDKEAKLKMNESISQSSPDEDLKKRAQVVLDRTKNIEEFGGKLPSYLAIDSKSTDVDIDVPVEPTKSDEFKNELPSYLDVGRKCAIDIDQERAGRSEWVPQSDRDAEELGWVIVHPGKWLGCEFAIKVFKCKPPQAFKWNEEELKKEAQSLVALQHPHVVRFVGFGQDEEKCLFLMELMDGDLKTFMKKNVGPFNKLDVINQIAKGMYYMHEREYVHGDLKCTNILVKKLGDRVLQVKIGDLRGSQNLKNWNRDAFEKASKIRRPRWTAPEAIDKYGGVEKPTDEQLKRSDVYSFGMTCYEIVTGKYPFDGIKEENGLLKHIQEGRVEEKYKLPDDLDEDLKGMIRQCWSKEPSKRPTFAQICQHLNTSSVFSRMCTPVLSIGRFWKQLLNLWGSNTSSVNSGSDGSYPHVAIIPHEHLERISTVFKGDGSEPVEVFEAKWLNCTVAVKKLNFSSSKSTGAEGSPNARQFPYEVQYLIEVSHHPCTVQLIGLSENPDGKYEIVMEYMKMNLRNLVDQNKKKKKKKKKAGGAKGGPFNFEKSLLIITKLALGMVYLHSRGLVHRDLKPDNVLVVDYNENVDVKIADFGVSHLKTIAGTTNGYFDGVGTGYYRAPEVMPLVKPGERFPSFADIGKELNEPARRIIENLRDEADLDAMKATDVYSFGMVCFIVLTGEEPYSDLISEGRISEYPKVWNGDATLKWTSDPHHGLKLLVEQCVCLDPRERPTFQQICEKLHKIPEPKPN